MGKIWDKYIKNERIKNVITALLIVLIWGSVYLLFYHPFLSIDDHSYVERIYGINSGSYDYHTIFIKWLYSWVIVSLCKAFPNVAWYTIVFQSLCLIGLWILVSTIIEKFEYKLALLIANLVCVYCVYETCIAIRFTKVSVFLSVISVIIISLTGISKWKKIVMYILFFIASLIRTDSCMPALVYLVFYTIYRFVRRDKESENSDWKHVLKCYIFPIVFLVIIWFAAKKSNLLFHGEASFKENYSLIVDNFDRASIQDYPVSMESQDLVEYAKSGISENDILVWTSWNYDWQLISKEISQAIQNRQSRTQPLITRVFSYENLKDFFKLFPLGFLQMDMFYFLIIILVLVLAGTNDIRRAVITILYVLGLLMALEYYLYIGGRYLQHRIDIGIVLAAALLILFMNDNIEIHPQKIFGYGAVVLLLAITPFQSRRWGEDDVQIHDENELNDNYVLFNNVSQDKSHFYTVVFSKQYAGEYYEYIDAYRMYPLGFKANVNMSNGDQGRSFFRDEYGVDNAYTGLLDNEDGYLMTDERNNDLDIWKKYISEHTGKDVELILVKKCNGKNIYRVVSSNKIVLNRIGVVDDTDGIIEGSASYYLINNYIHIIGNVHKADDNGFRQNDYLEIVKKDGSVLYYILPMNEDVDISEDEAGHYSYVDSVIELDTDSLSQASVIVDIDGVKYRKVLNNDVMER